MRRRLLLFFVIFVFFILVFFLQKIGFILIHGSINERVGMLDLFRILYHGLPIDISMSGYLSIIPLFLLIASVWVQNLFLRRTMNIYFCIILGIIVAVSVLDVILYNYWRFHLDPVILFYIRNPREAFASGTLWEWLSGVLSTIIFFIGLYYCYCLTVKKMFGQLASPRYPFPTSIVLFLLTGVSFLSIRGGMGTSPMNVSYAYFSDRVLLNHAAINPVFNFIYSLNKYDNFESQYQFYEKVEAEQVFNQLHEAPENDSETSLLRVEHPNIILVILESFLYEIAVDSIYAPNLSRLAKEGVSFENFYANSFRTDRGLVSILSGYPAHPTTAILKNPKKTERLPTIPKYLRSNGYENQSLYYGGDINFANMRSYFVGACGIWDVVSERDFPAKLRMSSWGVPDQLLMDRVSYDLTTTKQEEPFLKIVMTLSSHEPFDVPTRSFDNPFLNSISYVDACIGRFVSDLQKSDIWDNTLIVFISDHTMQNYPQGPNNYENIRFQIPMIWAGGAIKQPAVISDYGSQNDLAATLLSQLHIDPSDFRFSKNMLHPHGRKFSFYSYVNGFCMMDSANVFMYDNNMNKTLKQTGNPLLEKEAKSFFQMMYVDLGNR